MFALILCNTHEEREGIQSECNSTSNINAYFGGKLIIKEVQDQVLIQPNYHPETWSLQFIQNELANLVRCPCKK